VTWRPKIKKGAAICPREFVLAKKEKKKKAKHLHISRKNKA
jgi:hypothetical protein